MKRPLQSVSAIAGIAALGAALIGSYLSLTTSHASNPSPATEDRPATMAGGLPAAGFTDVAKSVTPAVVNITTSGAEEVSDSSRPRGRMEDFFGSPFGPRRFGPPMEPRERRGGGQGSGVIVTPDGYVLTNNHVIAGAKTVTVTLPDKREFKGRIVGSDPKSDIAVVKIDGTQLPTVTWGDSGRLQVGEYVLAVGNPFGLNSTVTLGIVSALGRGHMGITQYEDFIQTDAAINPGNSGGALVNTKGELIGINTAIFSQTGGYQGVGFAVSTSMSKPIYESLVKTGKVVRGFMGIGIQDLNQELAKSFNVKGNHGAIVTDVKEEGPADKAGLKQGDVIVSYQGTAIEDAVTLQRAVTRSSVGSKATVTVMRDGHEKDLSVTIGELPDNPQVAKAEAVPSEQPLAGLAVQELDRETAQELGLKGKIQGVVVTTIEPESDAERAGLMPGDVIREINRKPVTSMKDFDRAASDLKKGQTVLVLVNRRGASLYLSATI
ncbi:MAG: DegQ family serine endoprotease [Nitrospira sp.]|jgi:serine protease Do|nr:DegQ family serine endoprotease [Nitrospira sp.]